MREHSDCLKYAKLSDQDDIEAYLVKFERHIGQGYQASTAVVKAYASMPTEQCGDYSEAKEVICLLL